MATTIGIDLGTTNSCVAFIDTNGEPVVIPNNEGSRTTPSVVSQHEDGTRTVGNPAKRQAATRPDQTIFAVKRLMGRRVDAHEVQSHATLVPYEIAAADNGDAWVKLGGKLVSPQEVSAEILRAMKKIAEDYLGATVTDAIVTVPAYFDDAQRQATRVAGQIAGLDVKRIINEPTAAAVAYGFGQKAGQKIAVYDLGGGTFDISVLEIVDGVFKVRSTSGDTHLGGEDFDQTLVDHAAKLFLAETGIDLSKDKAAVQRLREQCERAKKELSSSLETEINLPFIAADSTGPKHLIQTLKRSDLEALVGDLVHRTLEPCRIALADAKLSVSDIDEVVLVGGMTRMPLVQKVVSEYFGKSPNKKVNPDEVVAVGAAIQGAAMSGQVEEVLLLDVTPLSLGVEVGGGIFHRLIQRNTTVPTQAKEIFTTSVDNQSFVPVHVLQGEREMASDNKTLAKFELSPILPAPRGVPQIEVTFDIDANGIVNVSAKDLGTGRSQNVSIVAGSGLTTEQVESIIRTAEQARDTDVRKKEFAELKNNAESLLYTSERAVQECAGLVGEEALAPVQDDITNLRSLLEEGNDLDSIREALQRLEHSAYSLAEAMYNSAGS